MAAARMKGNSPRRMLLATFAFVAVWLAVAVLNMYFGVAKAGYAFVPFADGATLEFGRVRYLPAALGRVNARRQTPVNALLLNMVIGVGALLTGRTDQIITISGLGAVTLYIFGMVTVLALRRKEPELERPYRAPGYPFTPVVALVIGLACLVALIWLNIKLSLIYFMILALAYIWFHFFVKRGIAYEQSYSSR